MKKVIHLVVCKLNYIVESSFKKINKQKVYLNFEKEIILSLVQTSHLTAFLFSCACWKHKWATCLRYILLGKIWKERMEKELNNFTDLRAITCSQMLAATVYFAWWMVLKKYVPVEQVLSSWSKRMFKTPEGYKTGQHKGPLEHRVIS